MIVSFLTMFIIAVISSLIAPELHPLLLVASIGASIILVFVLPTSPVSQPYSLIVGNVVSAFIGVACANLPFELYLNAAICISCCMFAMFALNCIHPPAGATAMMPVIVGSEAVGGYYFAIFPVLVNMIILVILGVIFHRLWLNKEYPSRPMESKDPIHKHKDASPLAMVRHSQKRLGTSAASI